MAVPDAAEFKEAFPEFSRAPDTLVESRIELASQRLGAVWQENDERHTQGILWKAAHLLATSPNAREMALVSDDGSSIYEREFMSLQRSVTAGRRAFIP